MRQSLQARCDLLIANEEKVRKAIKFEFLEMNKLAALVFTSQNREVDSAHLKECSKLLRKNASIFSNWRGIMQTLVITKMALSDDPQAYFDGVNAVYQKLTERNVFRMEGQAMCAMTLYDQCPPEKMDETIAKTLKQYDAARDAHPWLTDPDDLTLIALMVMTGQDVEIMNARAEECYELVKQLFKLYPETKQMISHVLALSDKPAQEKVDIFWSLYQALRAAKIKLLKDRMIAILAAYVDLEYPQDQLVGEIGEVEQWLKRKHGYGALGVGGPFRRMMASVLVLQDHEPELGKLHTSTTTTAIVQAVAQEIIETIIYIIVVDAIEASRSSSN